MVHLYEMPRTVKFIETKSRMVVTKGSGEGRMASCLMVQTFSFARWKVFWKMDNVDSYSTM